MDDEHLIEHVRVNPVLYDLEHKKYMDSSYKNDIWEKIAQDLQTEGSVCKARWTNIRDTYKKSLKRCITKSKSAKKKRIYKYSEQLNFLKTIFEESGCVSNIEDREPIENETQENFDYFSEDTKYTIELNKLIEIKTEDPNQKNKYTKGYKKKSITEKPSASRTQMHYDIEENNTTPSQHPVDAFLASIATSLKKLSPLSLHLAKEEIFKTVQKYELETIIGAELPE